MLDGLIHSSGILATFGISAGAAALGTAAIGAGVSIYGASQAGKGGAGAAPQPTDIFKVATTGKNKGTNLAGRQATGLLDYYDKNVPGFVALQDKYGPELMGQMFGQTGQFLGGVSGQPGFNALQFSSGQQAGKTIGQLREEELRQMTGQTGITRGLMESLSPEQASAVSRASRTAEQAQNLESGFMGRSSGMMDQYGSRVGQYGSTLGDVSGYAGTTISDEQAQGLAGGILGGVNPYVGETISGANADTARANQMAQDAFSRRGTLSPEEQRASQQQARESFSASGRLGGNAAIAAEIQNREGALARRRSEAATLGQQAYGQQLGAAGQQLQTEQVMYNQRGSNIERDISLQQTKSAQALNAAQQRLATQQARYGQLGSEQDREIARRQAMFSQSIAGGAQQTAERQLGFGQGMDIEQQRERMRNEAAQAGARSFDMAKSFYTDPGLAALQNAPLSYSAGSKNLAAAMIGGPESSGTFDYNMPLNMAMSQAGAQNESNMANYQIASANAQAKAKMYSDIGSSLMGAGFNMAGAGAGGAGAGGAYTQSGSSPWGKVNYSYV
jgi:hypothetical protein